MAIKSKENAADMIDGNNYQSCVSLQTGINTLTNYNTIGILGNIAALNSNLYKCSAIAASMKKAETSVFLNHASIGTIGSIIPAIWNDEQYPTETTVTSLLGTASKLSQNGFIKIDEGISAWNSNLYATGSIRALPTGVNAFANLASVGILGSASAIWNDEQYSPGITATSLFATTSISPENSFIKIYEATSALNRNSYTTGSASIGFTGVNAFANLAAIGAFRNTSAILNDQQYSTGIVATSLLATTNRIAENGFIKIDGALSAWNSNLYTSGSIVASGINIANFGSAGEMKNLSLISGGLTTLTASAYTNFNSYKATGIIPPNSNPAITGASYWKHSLNDIAINRASLNYLSSYSSIENFNSKFNLDEYLSNHVKKSKKPSQNKNKDEIFIETYLAKIDLNFYNMWTGAIEAFHSNNADKIRHFSVSIRELFTHFMLRFAPDEQIKAWSKDPQYYHNEKPTRKARYLYFYRNISGSFPEEVKQGAFEYISLLDTIQKGTHEIKPNFPMKAKIIFLLKSLLETHFSKNN